MITLNLRFDEGIEPIDLTSAKAVVSQLDKQAPVKIPDAAVVNARIVNEQTVRDLNRRFSGKDEATDVLSFNYAENHPQAAEGELGDIVISYQHIVRQARDAGTNEATELALLLLHGILHILGVDHQNPKQRKKLDKIQASVMEAAGLTYRDFGWQDN